MYNTRHVLSDAKFYESYSRWDDEKSRYETWDESVERVMSMHREFFADKLKDSEELRLLMDYAESVYKNSGVLGAQRALQFGGEQLLNKHARLYNCVSSHCDRPAFFQEFIYWLLCGAGAGFSVQKHHIAKLPNIHKRNKQPKTFNVEDSIEGWADACGVLISSYMEDATFPEYHGRRVYFNLNDIRPKGAFISGGFKAPGPEPLRKALDLIERLLEKVVSSGRDYLKPIEAYDICMYMADAVIAGGVRRSATICLFSKDDTEMLAAKTGNWFEENPQRGRSNNSIVLVRDEVSLDEFTTLMESVKEFGEPGFIFVESKEHTFNPCVEIGMWPVTESGESGWQGCVTQDTKLITENGIVYIGDVADKGETISVWNGKGWSDVKPLKTGELREMFRVSFGDGSYLDCTANHRFMIKNRFDKDYYVVETHEMVDIVNKSKYPIYIPRSDVEYTTGVHNEYAYEYGYILGDGCATLNGTNYRTPFAEIYNDINLPLRGTKGNISAPKNGGTLPFYRHYFVDVDKEFSHKLKYNEGLHKDIFAWNKPSIIKFFAGWIDSDGTKTENGCRIYGREDKIRDAQLLLTKIGINSSVNCMASKGDRTNKSYRLNDVWYIQISDTGELYSNRIELVSKEVKYKGKYQTIKSVERLDGSYDSYCFEESVLGSGLFNNVLTKQCNLTEINGSKCTSKESFFSFCKASAILGTLQAAYTKFDYLTKETEEIFQREALIGCSITGWMNEPDVLFNEDNMREGAEIVKTMNAKVAKLIGINPSARCTCVKPSGNASTLLGTASGIHGEKAPRFFRNAQMNKEGEVPNLIRHVNPDMVEQSVWGDTDYVISFPVVAPEHSIFTKDLLGVKQLEYVKMAQQAWVESGTNEDLCADKTLRHNVSNTITVDNWSDVTEYVYENRNYFAGISFLASSGDKDYAQAPFTEVKTHEEIVDEYGEASLFASGLIVDGLAAYGDDLWKACSVVIFNTDRSEDSHMSVLQNDWARRARKFAKTYFEDDIVRMTYCLKDVHLLHKWHRIANNYKPIDWSTDLTKKEFTEIDTMGAQACSGGACEISF